jgi:hypothetical protein
MLSQEMRVGGYKATQKNRNTLRKYKAGKSIGFTARASLKAKGILPRSNGRYVLGPKYSGTGKEKVLKKATKTRRRSRRSRKQNGGSCETGVCRIGGGAGLVFSN